MAGIGFRLQKLFAEDYFSSRTKAYGYSLFVTAGPWLIVIGTISIIRFLIHFLYPIPMGEQQLFIISVSYCFIFSQIIYGIIQLPVTRYVADLLYDQDVRSIYSSFLGVVKVSLALAFLLWLLFALFTPLPFYYDLILLILFLSLDIIWIQSIYLTAAKNFQAIALAFFFGGIVSIVGMGAVSFFRPHFMYAQAFLLLGSFTTGIIVTLGVLSLVLVRMFPGLEAKDQFNFLRAFDKYPELALSGLLYNVGIWVCNFIIWFGEGHQIIAGSFRYNPIYDSSVFWAYLTITPTYVFFTVSIETRFYERYKKFLGAVNHGGTLKQVEHLKSAMNLTVRQELKHLLMMQGAITGIAIFIAWILMSQMSQSTMLYSIFQLAAVGAFANGMVLVCTLMLLYFEDRRGAVMTSVIFCLTNALITLILLPLGYNGYGIGFALGSVTALLFSLSRLLWYVRDIDYYLFCRAESMRAGRRLFTSVAGWFNRFS
ncbi:hypothetical protein E4665_07990 [Sporolactobacillus shoreae]|uniref:Exopolysaccharide Pel transporter PelG n=1 Tax=Sporolactobacillus shoreae TaxID=1465501 RepID=A0A4Z0GMX7_9BACL|nr:exopolysaccharide Pel transporter PelG [Sporolactobacillus shoreae]TGA98455.1 hypothetical protein E4665_07990 [Sporolactobacillus shoreae]